MDSWTGSWNIKDITGKTDKIWVKSIIYLVVSSILYSEVLYQHSFLSFDHCTI